MGNLLQRIEQTSTFSNLAIERMQTIEEHLDGLDGILHEIDAVAAQAHLLALNGQIEAARFGDQGAAFAIVAMETAKMANHAVVASKTIRKTTETVSAGIDSTSRELRERASADTHEATLSRDEVNRALDAMTALHDEMRRTIEHARLDSDQLAREISEAVMAMQFQDHGEPANQPRDSHSARDARRPFRSKWALAAQSHRLRPLRSGRTAWPENTRWRRSTKSSPRT